MLASVLCLFLELPRVSLQCAIVAFSGHTHINHIPMATYESQKTSAFRQALETEVFKTILPYMGVAENLVLLLEPFDHTFILSSIEASI